MQFFLIRSDENDIFFGKLKFINFKRILVLVGIFSCERHARNAASDFAKSCVQYINTNLPVNVQVSASHTDFMKRFIEIFSEHFETEFAKRRAAHQKPNGTINSIEEEPEPATEVTTKPSKPFFRRLSFKGLRKGKVCYTAQN